MFMLFGHSISGIDGVEIVTKIGANAGHCRAIRRLAARAAIGIDSLDRQGGKGSIFLLARRRLRYHV